MSMSLTIGSGWIFADWSIEGLRGEAALGSFRLLMDIRLRGPGGRGVAALTAVCVVAYVSSSSANRYLTTFHPAAGPILMPATMTSWGNLASLAADLNQPTVEALEAMRMGGVLDLNLKLQCRVTIDGKLHQVLDE